MSITETTPPKALTPSTPVLELADLDLTARSRTGDVTITKGVTLEVSAGEIVGIVGETGSGKSMTLRGILDLLPSGVRKTSGRVSFDGVSMEGASRRRWRAARGRDVGLIPQDPWSALDPLLTVRTHFHHALSSNGDFDRRSMDGIALRTLGSCGIADPERVLGCYPGTLSGGMAQRVVISLVLACAPKVILADEVTTSLDVTVQREVLDLLRDRARSDLRGVLLVSHDPGVVANYCDRVIVMYGGRVVEDGQAGEIFGEPVHPYTQALVASMWGGERGDRSKRTDRPPQFVTAGCPYFDRCPHRMDVCERDEPELAMVERGGRVACHLY